MRSDDLISEAPSRMAIGRRDAVAMPDFSAAMFAHVFPAPFMAFVWPDSAELNEELRPQILEHASRSDGMRKSNFGGEHSEAGQLEFCGDAGRRLVHHMFEMADGGTQRSIAELPSPPRMSPWTFRWTLHARVKRERPRRFQSGSHAGATWSGTYYVDLGAPTSADGGTPLNLFDPCQGRANTFLQPAVSATYEVRPEPGLMAPFPSYMPHAAHGNAS